MFRFVSKRRKTSKPVRMPSLIFYYQRSKGETLIEFKIRLRQMSVAQTIKTDERQRNEKQNEG